MKKLIPVFIMFFAVFGVFAEDASVLDYFPCNIGATWTYANNSGKITDINILENSVPDSRVKSASLYLMVNQMPGLGSTSTMYTMRDNKVLILVTKNVLGQYRENQPPYPILAPAGQEWRYNDRGDDLRYKTTKTSINFDGKTYNDCILVEENIVSGNNILRTKKSYYAKNVGLVYVTLQSEGEKESVFMKLSEYSPNK
jgi:hypothetical protein